MQLTDALGTVHHPVQGSARIASLVPSITELLCDLGLAGQMVARTGYCIHPHGMVRKIAKVGGTKTINLGKLARLAPSHVVVNIDENEKPAVDAIRAFVPHVIVTHPQVPADNPALFRLLGGIFNCTERAAALETQFSLSCAVLQARKHRTTSRTVLYLIWKDPWMTVAPSTYISATLAQIGWKTLPDKGLRASTDAAAETGRVRYPVITLTEPWLEEVDTILLSSEPYHFSAADCAELAALPQFRGKTIRLIDGEMTSWFGSRAIAGNAYLVRLSDEMG